MLIVDDVDVMRELLREILQDLGFNSIEEAADGKAALTIYQEKKSDIVFLDINMPDKPGLAVLEEIKIINPDAKVIMLSANSSFFNVKTALEMGAKAFVAKPFFKDKIRDVLEDLDDED